MARKKRVINLAKHRFQYPLISKEDIVEIIVGKKIDGRFDIVFDQERCFVELKTPSKRAQKYRFKGGYMQPLGVSSIKRVGLPKSPSTPSSIRVQLQTATGIVDINGSGGPKPAPAKVEKESEKTKRINEEVLRKMITDGKMRIIYNGKEVRIK